MAKGDTTREAILEEGLALASRVGFEPLSIGALAEAVGMSKSGLYAHFRDKEDLQLEVLRKGVDLFTETVVAPSFRAPRGEARLRALFESWLAWAESKRLPGGCVFISAANEYDDRSGPVRDYLVHSQKQWLDSLARAAELAIDTGDFRPDLDVDQFAHDFYAIVLAYNHFRRLLRDPRAVDRARTGFERLLAASRLRPATES
jgi:AcrR family transcriptional regulator